MARAEQKRKKESERVESIVQLYEKIYMTVLCRFERAVERYALVSHLKVCLLKIFASFLLFFVLSIALLLTKKKKVGEESIY